MSNTVAIYNLNSLLVVLISEHMLRGLNYLLGIIMNQLYNYYNIFNNHVQFFIQKKYYPWVSIQIIKI